MVRAQRTVGLRAQRTQRLRQLTHLRRLPTHHRVQWRHLGSRERKALVIVPPVLRTALLVLLTRQLALHTRHRVRLSRRNRLRLVRTRLRIRQRHQPTARRVQLTLLLHRLTVQLAQQMELEDKARPIARLVQPIVLRVPCIVLKVKTRRNKICLKFKSKRSR